ncbi:MAG: helix-turn-helix domain-containing protein [Aeromicrobium erythreum]
MATTTATQRREQAKDAYNAFLAVCPSRQLLDRLSDKWVVLVLCALGGDADGGEVTSLRYSELARTIAGVSPKMLTQTLRALERDGLLTRTVKPTVPVTVAYALTDLGRSLHRTTTALRTWAQEHMPEVQEHRDRFDADRGRDAAEGPRA